MTDYVCIYYKSRAARSSDYKKAPLGLETYGDVREHIAKEINHPVSRVVLSSGEAGQLDPSKDKTKVSSRQKFVFRVSSASPEPRRPAASAKREKRGREEEEEEEKDRREERREEEQQQPDCEPDCVDVDQLQMRVEGLEALVKTLGSQVAALMRFVDPMKHQLLYLQQHQVYQQHQLKLQEELQLQQQQQRAAELQDHREEQRRREREWHRKQPPHVRF